MIETWMPIVGYEGMYEVSDGGRIRSLPRVVRRNGRRMVLAGRQISGSVAGRGYRKVGLSRDGKTEPRYVHAVVLETFIGPRPQWFDACHGNGDRSDNRLANLRWDTRSNNHADKASHGTDACGERHPCARLSKADVIAIRAASGSCREVGQRFGVGAMQVHRIKARKSWSHLK